MRPRGHVREQLRCGVGRRHRDVREHDALVGVSAPRQLRRVLPRRALDQHLRRRGDSSDKQLVQRSQQSFRDTSRVHRVNICCVDNPAGEHGFKIWIAFLVVV